MINKLIRIIGISLILIDLFIINNLDSIVNFGVCIFFISDYNFVYVVRKIGILRKNLKYVEIWNFKYFKVNFFKIDFINV